CFRHRARHAADGRATRVRAILHHESARRGNWSWPERQLRNHPGTPGSNIGGEHSSNRHHLHHSAPTLHRVEEMTRILIVDDEETIRLALRKFLRSRGYEVEIAGSGDQALECLGQESFSLMLCDVRMPGMTGVQVVPQARALD